MPDAELDAMATVYGALDQLEEPAQERVLRWAAAKLGIDLATSRAAQKPGAEEGQDSQEFREIGDLVHAAQPSSGPERALVVGYWFQEYQGEPGWTGADINSTLKNMGTGLANVTKTLDSLKARNPALVMQIAKSGRSRQARKTYKLTAAGVQTVKQMVAHSTQAEAA